MPRADELKWTCEECGDEFISSTDTFGLDSCECGEAWVDHERMSLRHSAMAVRI